MYFTIGILIGFCILSSSKCSFFDEAAIVNENGDTFVRLGSRGIPQKISFNTREVVNESFIPNVTADYEKKHARYDGGTDLILSHAGSVCVMVNYSSDSTTELKASFDISNSHWYGGTVDTRKSVWPVEKAPFNNDPFITDWHSGRAVKESYWLISNGYYIYVFDTVPLFVHQNGSIFQLIARNVAPYMKTGKLALDFLVCKLDNVRQAQEHAVKYLLGKPKRLPDVRRVTHPVWSLLLKYRYPNVDHEKVLKFATDLDEHGFTGQLSIDYQWEACIGSLIPDTKLFPDFGSLTSTLKKLNFTLCLAIYPTADAGCDATFNESLANGWFVKTNPSLPYQKSFEYLDFTNPNATSRFGERLRNLRRKYGIDSFRAVDGQSTKSFLNLISAVFYRKSEDHPETIVKEYMKLLASLGSNMETSVARGTQQHGLIVSNLGGHADWSRRGGLKSIIPTVLQMNILGYSFVQVDMRGSSYEDATKSKELFIRWVQMNVFLPSMLFSVPPWDFNDTEVIQLTKKFVDLRAKYSDYIVHLMEENVETGAPVIRPLWWIAPNDSVALTCDSEFLLGDKILVAPVLEEGHTQRNIYLPPGVWKDANTLKCYIGPTNLTYSADLTVLPYFINKLPVDIIYQNGYDKYDKLKYLCEF